jgi:Zn finger protein HypA/HybF involved in hydrogenase expression
MGELYQFRCMSCKYETQSSMGQDRGMDHSFAPYLCRTCQTVENLIDGDAEYRCGPISVPVTPKCKTCESTNSLVRWDLLTCPKCEKKDMHYHHLPISID